MPLSEAMDYVWRVKRWGYTWETATEQDRSFTPTSVDTEKDFVCGPRLIKNGVFVLYLFGRYFSATNAQADTLVAFSWLPLSSLNVYYFELDGLYLPNMIFQGSWPSTFQRVDYLTFEGEYKWLQFDGISFVEKKEKFLMFPEEWWPYDPEDGGGPIYNTSTGQQIRSFP